jgi:glyoxylase-like metal-dependent hydrolase (beta-lactamase superfamily II)
MTREHLTGWKKEELNVDTDRTLARTKHFRLEQLEAGIYAAIHVDGGAAIGNAGIVDLGDRTLVYDTFFTPQAGEDLRAAAEALTGRPVDVVINSHYHNDHIWGNQAFSPDTDIISTRETHRLIVETRGHDDYDVFLGSAEASLESTLAAFQATEDEEQRRQIAVWIDYNQSLVDAKPILDVRAPNMTFVEHLVFHGTERSAELIPYSQGHSADDLVLFLPQERIAFMADLLFIDYHPWVGAGDPGNLQRILEDVSQLAPRQVVPGHGPVGTAASLDVMRCYISVLEELVGEMIEGGEPEERIDEMDVPAPFGDWLFAAFFPLNLHFIYEHWQG